MAVITRHRAQREEHPTITVGDLAWRVPFTDYRHGTRAVRVRVLGEGTQRHVLHHREVAVQLLEDDLPPSASMASGHTSGGDTVVDSGDRGRFGRWLGPAGTIVSVPDVEVGPDALRDHATAIDTSTAADLTGAGGAAVSRRYRIPPKWALDLFCPVHGHIHVLPDALCDGEYQLTPPLAGDAIRLAAPWRWAARSVRVGDMGVLDGFVGKPSEQGSVIFHARSFRDDHVVSSSGGPGTISTPITELTRTEDTTTMTVWQWRDGIAGAGKGIEYAITVPVWDWHPTN